MAAIRSRLPLRTSRVEQCRPRRSASKGPRRCTRRLQPYSDRTGGSARRLPRCQSQLPLKTSPIPAPVCCDKCIEGTNWPRPEAPGMREALVLHDARRLIEWQRRKPGLAVRGDRERHSANRRVGATKLGCFRSRTPHRIDLSAGDDFNLEYCYTLLRRQ